MDYIGVFVAIATVELEPVVQFYRTVFQCDPQIEEGDRYAEFHLKGLRLALFKPKADAAVEFVPQPSSLSLCVEVSELEQCIQRLKTLSIAPPETIRTASHGREFDIYDPLGNRLILHESSSIQE
jgi:predicted enzyme related to lactoylglutathione lyase